MDLAGNPTHFFDYYLQRGHEENRSPPRGFTDEPNEFPRLPEPSDSEFLPIDAPSKNTLPGPKPSKAVEGKWNRSELISFDDEIKKKGMTPIKQLEMERAPVEVHEEIEQAESVQSDISVPDTPSDILPTIPAEFAQPHAEFAETKERDYRFMGKSYYAYVQSATAPDNMYITLLSQRNRTSVLEVVLK